MRNSTSMLQHMHFKTVGYMSTSDWLVVAGIGVSAGTLVTVGFGAVWLQHYLEDLRLKREVFRRVVGNVHSILYDCQHFRNPHSFNESGIVAINQVRAAFKEATVQDAWRVWHATEDVEDFAKLVRAMSVACKLNQYRSMEPKTIADTFSCSCVEGVE